MVRFSRALAGPAALLATSLFIAVAASLLDVLPPPVAVALTIAPVVLFLAWQLLQSRRALVQEHAAHVAKSAYLADMSHELRTPLNAIIGFAEIIRDQALGPCGHDKYPEFARDIHEASTHLLHLINDVLELSKIEAGRLELNEEQTDLRAILVSCQRLLHHQIRRGGLYLTVETADNLPEIHCDPLKVKQIILNLMTNAIKFTHRGGCIAVRAYLHDGRAAISVTDNGIGIPAHEIPKVLTPFVQAAHTRLMNNEGTGLGLPLSKKLMELHGGHLDLRSEPEIGTSVTITFPAERCRRDSDRWQHPAAYCEAPASA